MGIWGNKSLEVAILLDDLSETKKLSAIFRKTNVLPYFYDNLRDFWNATMEKAPDLSIVDVKKMSDGALTLRNHQRILNEEMPVAFFYCDETYPLLHSTFEIFTLGTIKKGDNYRGQLKTILRRFNKIRKLENENKKIKEEISLGIGTLAQKTNIKEANHYDDLLHSYCENIENLKGSEDFIHAIGALFAGRNEVVKFSAVELSQNMQRLVPVAFEADKYCKMDSLWIGKTMEQGIAPLAQSMAMQTMKDLLGDDIVVIQIKGIKQYADILISIKLSSKEYRQHFNWSFFEKYLSGTYQYFLNRNHQTILNTSFLNSYELVSLLDCYYSGGVKNNRIQEISLIDLNLSALKEKIRKLPKIRFYWNEFAADFISRFKQQFQFEYKTSISGVDHIAFVVDKKIEASFFAAIKLYVGRYNFTTFFTGETLPLDFTVNPTVRIIPISSEAYFQYLEHNVIFSDKISDDRFYQPQKKNISEVNL